jgi:hypothetical protein
VTTPWLRAVWLGLAAVSCIALFFVPAPYGRYADRLPGPRLSRRWGWLLMESPAWLAFAFALLRGPSAPGAAAWVLAAFWFLHYTERAFVDSWRARDENQRIPLIVVLLAIVFNCVNGTLNGAALVRVAAPYDVRWLADPRFLLGATCFFVGYAVNRVADRALRSLRGPGESGYRAPQGPLFRWVSCPNYLGESVEWIGWAIATWSFAGAAFAVWTLANLVPRAIAHHAWYRAHFPEYPRERRALVPFLL